MSSKSKARGADKATGKSKATSKGGKGTNTGAASLKAVPPKSVTQSKAGPKKAAGAKSAPKNSAKNAAKSKAAPKGKITGKTTGKSAGKPDKKPAAKSTGKSTEKSTEKSTAKTTSKSKGKTNAKAARKTSAKSPAKNKVVKLSHIDNRTFGKVVSKLKEMREESVTIVNTHMQSDLQPREESSDVGDDLDQAATERDREFNLIMHQRHLRRLRQIDEAFARIQDGTYGLCEGTDEPINPKRLLIMPLARYSLEYQEQQEKTLGRGFTSEDFLESDESFSTDD